MDQVPDRAGCDDGGHRLHQHSLHQVSLQVIHSTMIAALVIGAPNFLVLFASMIGAALTPVIGGPRPPVIDVLFIIVQGLVVFGVLKKFCLSKMQLVLVLI